MRPIDYPGVGSITNHGLIDFIIEFRRIDLIVNLRFRQFEQTSICKAYNKLLERYAVFLGQTFARKKNAGAINRL